MFIVMISYGWLCTSYSCTKARNFCDITFTFDTECRSFNGHDCDGIARLDTVVGACSPQFAFYLHNIGSFNTMSPVVPSASGTRSRSDPENSRTVPPASTPRALTTLSRNHPDS